MNRNENDFMALLEALKNNVYRNTHTSSLAVVKGLKATNYGVLQEVDVLPFPQSERTGNFVLQCYSYCDEVLNVGDIVVVLFLDRDYRQNLKTILNGSETSYVIKDYNLHSIDYGLIIKKFSLPKNIKLNSDKSNINVILLSANLVEKNIYDNPILSIELDWSKDYHFVVDNNKAIVDVELTTSLIDTSSIKFTDEAYPQNVCVGFDEDNKKQLICCQIESLDGSLKNLRFTFTPFGDLDMEDITNIRVSCVINGYDLL